jgi:hypothetical protein
MPPTPAEVKMFGILFTISLEKKYDLKYEKCLISDITYIISKWIKYMYLTDAPYSSRSKQGHNSSRSKQGHNSSRSKQGHNIRTEQVVKSVLNLVLLYIYGLKIEISLVVNFHFITNQNELKF